MPNTPVLIEDHIEKVERFQSLQAGQYWSALAAVPTEGISKGMTLLIESIRWVDEVPHTIVLRTHPANFGKRIEIQKVGSNGTVYSTTDRFEQHRFLTSDFLQLFEFQPDHLQIRNQEVQSAQQLISTLQHELLATQSNPEKMHLAIASEMKPSPGETASPTSTAVAVTPDSAAVAVATGTVANALSGGITEANIEQLKLAASNAHEIATLKATWIRTKTTEIAEAIKAVTPYYSEQAAAALASTEDTRLYVAKLLKGIESLDLYIGKDVEVFTVCEGQPAPDGMPLSLVQQKRVMDEELAVWTDLSEWFDFSNVELFYDALRKHPGLIDQIFPTQRCVLTMCTTMRWINYGDNWTNNQRNEANRVVFLLVRNGENVHVVWSGVESHLKTDRLFPTSQEQKKIFSGIDGSNIKFEDVAYTDRLADHDRMALHYKRFLLLLCGLDHRVNLFGNFYDEPQSMNFVSLAFQQKYFNFIHDDETLALPGDDRPSVSVWEESMNALVQPGSRLLCSWSLMLNPDSAPAAVKYDGRHTDHRYTPVKPHGVAIVAQDGNELIVRCDVKGYSYSTHKDREFSCRVAIDKVKNSDWRPDSTAFLCLDAVTPEDLNYYIHSRAARRNHVSYIRFFKMALQLVTADRAAEAGTRKALLTAMAEGGIASDQDHVHLVDKAVITWRAKNRGKDLPLISEGISPAVWKSLLDQIYMLAGDGQARIAGVEKYVRDLGRVPLRLTVTGNAALTVYVEPFDSECDNRVQAHPWVHCITLTPTNTGYKEKTRTWALLPKAAVKESVVHQWPEADKWVNRTSAFKSYSSKQSLLADICIQAERVVDFGSQLPKAQHTMLLSDWGSLRYDWMQGKKHIKKPALYVPLGVHINTESQIELLCLVAMDADQLLARLAPDAESQSNVFSKATSYLMHPTKVRDSIKKCLAARQFEGWSIATAPVSLLTSPLAPFAQPSSFIGLRDYRVDPLLDPILDTWLSTPSTTPHKWLAPCIYSAENGGASLDDALCITRASDYAPTRLRMFSVSHRGDNTPGSVWPAWVDLCPGEKAPMQVDGGAWHQNDLEWNLLIDSEFYKGNAGTRSASQVYRSPTEARTDLETFAATNLKNDQDVKVRLVPSRELPSLPQPPEGYERWYRLID